MQKKANSVTVTLLSCAVMRLSMDWENFIVQLKPKMHSAVSFRAYNNIVDQTCH